jgi:Fe-S-cluster containining protein
METSMTSLRNYRNLVEKVDDLCRRIITVYGEYLVCGKGCNDCCRHISLFPVEAIALTVALGELPGAVSEQIRARARSASFDACPLLENGLCLLYASRPIICRTHGFPLLSGPEEIKKIDFCPKNFTGITTFPADAVLNLDMLNTTLAAINSVFIASWGNLTNLEQKRIPLAEALLLGA